MATQEAVVGVACATSGGDELPMTGS